jgi:hypothetical protein
VILHDLVAGVRVGGSVHAHGGCALDEQARDTVPSNLPPALFGQPTTWLPLSPNGSGLLLHESTSSVCLSYLFSLADFLTGSFTGTHFWGPVRACLFPKGLRLTFI